MWLGGPKSPKYSSCDPLQRRFPALLYTHFVRAVVAERGLNLNVKVLSTPRRELLSASDSAPGQCLND